MSQSDRQIQEKFRRDALNVMGSHAEAISVRLESTERTVDRAADAIEKQGKNIDRLAASIDAQKESIDRLERAITQLVTGINAQKEVVESMVKQQGEFLKLATRQADIIGSLTAGKAS